MNWRIWYRPKLGTQWQDGGIFESRREMDKRLVILRQQGNEAKPEFIGKQRALVIDPKHLGV